MPPPISLFSQSLFALPLMDAIPATTQAGYTAIELACTVALLLSEGSGSYQLFSQIIEHYGIKESDFQLVNLSPDEAGQALKDGKVDVICHTSVLGNKTIQDILISGHAELIPIDQGDALKTIRPFLQVTIIPKGLYIGAPPMPETDIPTVSLVAHLLAHKDIDSAVIAEITRILFEHRNELVVQHPLASTIGPPGAGETLSLPLHSGARAYYMQDQPGFLVQYAEVIAVFMSMAVLIISGLWQLRSRLQRSQKNRADMYNNEILRLDDQIRKVEDLEQIDMYREQMFDIFRNVIEDYDVDRISFEAFQSFTLPWEVAIRTLRHREMVLMNLPLSEDQ